MTMEQRAQLIADEDPNKCEWCDEEGVGFNDDGKFLCEDCLFQDSCEKAFPPEQDIFPEDYET